MRREGQSPERKAKYLQEKTKVIRDGKEYNGAGAAWLSWQHVGSL
jgi:hypothetical protein